MRGHDPLLPPLLDWVGEPADTEEDEFPVAAAGLLLPVPLVVAVLLPALAPLEAVGATVAALLGLASLVPVVLESRLAWLVAFAACSTKSPKAAALAATTPATAILIRVASGARRLLFMVPLWEGPLGPTFESTVEKL
jgi:hypothetical protein